MASRGAFVLSEGEEPIMVNNAARPAAFEVEQPPIHAEVIEARGAVKPQRRQTLPDAFIGEDKVGKPAGRTARPGKQPLFGTGNSESA